MDIDHAAAVTRSATLPRMAKGCSAPIDNTHNHSGRPPDYNRVPSVSNQSVSAVSNFSDGPFLAVRTGTGTDREIRSASPFNLSAKSLDMVRSDSPLNSDSPSYGSPNTQSPAADQVKYVNAYSNSNKRNSQKALKLEDKSSGSSLEMEDDNDPLEKASNINRNHHRDIHRDQLRPTSHRQISSKSVLGGIKIETIKEESRVSGSFDVEEMDPDDIGIGIEIGQKASIGTESSETKVTVSSVQSAVPLHEINENEATNPIKVDENTHVKVHSMAAKVHGAGVDVETSREFSPSSSAVDPMKSPSQTSQQSEW